MFAIEHVEHCSLSSLSNTSNMSNIARLARDRTCRTLLVCQVIKHVNSRASCYTLCYSLYTWLFRARLVTIDKKHVKTFVQKTIYTKKQFEVIKYIKYNLINFDIVNIKSKNLRTIDNNIDFEQKK
jgi:hypothetical protein